jgi:hypothetical protein
MCCRCSWSLQRPCITAAAAVIGLTLAACGSGGPAKPSPSASQPATSSSAQPTTGAAAQVAVRKDWERFFNSSTQITIGARIGLIEDGEQLRQNITAQLKSPLVKAVTNRVSKVVLLSPARAQVTFTIYDAGNPILPDQPGSAVYQNGTWKVSKQSYCRLLLLQSNGVAPLPAACHNSG